MSPTSCTNQILRRLSTEDFDAIAPHLVRVETHLRQPLIRPHQHVAHVWFPESCMCSVIAKGLTSEAIEVGLIGQEGMTDHVAVPDDTSILESLVQVAGSAMALPSDAYIAWVNDRPKVMRLVLRYQQTLQAQLAYTALSHGSYTVNERLARWLAMSFDRTKGGELPFVHEFLAMMLGIRRAGVTDAVHVLEGHGAIRAARGRISLRDRATLEELANGSYGPPEAEYKRMMESIA